MGKLQRYWWPKTLLLFYLNEETIEAAFGYIEKDGVSIEVRQTFEGKKREHKLVEWYKEILQTYPKTYLATMLDTANQGAISGCSKQDLEKFDIKSSLVHTICIEDSWLAYVSLVEMKWFENKYKSLTLDFLFSPFVMLYDKVKPNLTNTPILTVLHQKGVLYVAVFSKEGLWFSQVMTVSEASLDDDMLESEEDDDIGLAFDLDSMETDIEPISEVDTLDDFKEDITSENLDTDEEAELELLEYDLDFFDRLKSSIENFYHNDLYKHDFLEAIAIYDIDAQIGKDIVRYIEDELFMSCSLQTFDPIESMSKLVIKDFESKK
ncbi:hypothetical protein [Hydrogenimonas thermophila]|uniref:Uncharacterized protein n=1 Tax=Hydrogenimonas thermophila TaxID=223786 RepID=A0A1I5P9W4_9BACT|nr:hypothetical protein [Hydrogenimonas thermophila]WOE69646.1 hypothetical protein RZR91_11130 [Hydrogenimonas thermophila]WOE72160.1 hypothetical protein RZR97_11120 [Hydrogenimonas thermophila]SFP30580.1 hypothetical protein SAMN05216234_11425 [Hydrogenimonas thermophila]